MRFISQHGDNTDIKHGNFEVGNCYGTLTLNRFCTKYITWSQEENYLEAPIHEVVSPNRNDCNSESFSANSQPNDTSEINSDISHNDHGFSSSPHDSSSATSVDGSSPKMRKDQEQIESLPWGYEWMLALPKNHLKLRTWNGIYSVYINLRAWRKVTHKSHYVTNKAN